VILVDGREGSRELTSRLGGDCLECLLNNAAGEAVGDVAFHGNGPDGDIAVGIEVKRITDLLTAETNGRLAATQLPRMLDYWDITWLLAVGEYRRDAEGQLSVRRADKFGHERWASYRVGSRPVPWGYLEAFLCELQEVGVRIKQVRDYDEAAEWVRVLYRWWDKPWTKHKAMRKLDSSRSGELLLPGLDVNTEQAVRTYATFPSLGFERALVAAHYFPNIRAAVNADIREWTEVYGVGKVIARGIIRAVKGEL
jgi:ERCC4-type nuclease